MGDGSVSRAAPGGPLSEANDGVAEAIATQQTTNEASRAVRTLQTMAFIGLTLGAPRGRQKGATTRLFRGKTPRYGSMSLTQRRTGRVVSADASSDAPEWTVNVTDSPGSSVTPARSASAAGSRRSG